MKGRSDRQDVLTCLSSCPQVAGGFFLLKNVLKKNYTHCAKAHIQGQWVIIHLNNQHSTVPQGIKEEEKYS